jgi:hypothetical protein
MNHDMRHKLVWGWLRLFLGWLEMSLAAAGKPDPKLKWKGDG